MPSDVSILYGSPGRNVVIDTNILVSSLWSKDGTPAQLMMLVLRGAVTPCYDFRIMEEYRNVLSRPKFRFDPWMVSALLARIEDVGVNVVPAPLNIPFIDEDDKKFYEVAVFTQSTLITGNMKHFPEEPFIVTPSDFLKDWR